MSEVHHSRLYAPTTRNVLRAAFLLIAGASVLPVGYAVIWSLFGTSVPGLLQNAPTSDWYALFFASHEWRSATLTSLWLAWVNAVLAVVTGVLVSFTSRLDDGQLRLTYAFLALLVSAFPMLLFALALRVSATRLGVDPNLAVIIGQWAIIFPFTYFVFDASSNGVPAPALWSSFVLGASVRQTLGRIYLPAVASAIFTAAAIAFLTSWDDAIMPVIVYDTLTETLSKRLWNLLNSDLEPYPAVVGTLFYAAFPAALAAALLLFGRSGGSPHATRKARDASHG